MNAFQRRYGGPCLVCGVVRDYHPWKEHTSFGAGHDFVATPIKPEDEARVKRYLASNRSTAR